MSYYLKYGFFLKLLFYEYTSRQLTISTHQTMVGYLLHLPNFDDWKWSTDKRCIRNEVHAVSDYKKRWSEVSAGVS